MERRDFVFYQGKTMTYTFIITIVEDGVEIPFDLTGYEARLELKKKLSDEDALLLFTSDPAAGLDLGTPTDGLVVLTISATQASSVEFILAEYQLELYTPGSVIVERPAWGMVPMSKEVII